MKRVHDVVAVEGEDVLLLLTRGMQGVQALGIEMRIQLSLVNIGTGRKTHHGCGQQSSEEDRGDDREQMARDSPSEHKGH